jgi:tetratricopeptide (TPR) repeat protein
LFLSYTLLFAEEKILSEEDILIAEMDVYALNKLNPAARAANHPEIIGADPRVNKVVTQDYVCDDICPDYGSLFLSYKGVDNIEECRHLGSYGVFSPGWHGYAGCSPVEVKINLVLNSTEKVPGVTYAGNSEYFLRVAKLKDIQRVESSGQDIPIRDVTSIFLNDIRDIETTEGEKLDKFKAALKIPLIEKDPFLEAQKYFAALNNSREYNPAEEAILLRKAVELNPKLFGAYYKLYEDVYRKAEVTYAKDITYLFEKLIQHKPDDAQAYYILAEAYSRLSSFDREDDNSKKAVRMLEKSVELKPDFIDAYILLAKYYSNLLDINILAARAQEKYLKLAQLSEEKRKVEEGQLEAFKSNYSHDPLAEGKALRWERKYGEAIEEFKKVIARYPSKDPYYPCQAWFQLGLLYKETEDTDKAIEAFKKVTELAYPYYDHFIPPAYTQLGIIYKERKDYAKARENLEQAMQLYQDKMKQDDAIHFEDRIEKIKEILASLP